MTGHNCLVNFIFTKISTQQLSPCGTVIQNYIQAVETQLYFYRKWHVYHHKRCNAETEHFSKLRMSPGQNEFLTKAFLFLFYHIILIKSDSAAI